MRRRGALHPARKRTLLGAVLGVAGCVELAGFGPERGLGPAPLYFQDAEAASGAGRCDGERPPFRFESRLPMKADCDSTVAPLAGRQSVEVPHDGWIGCDPCWADSAEAITAEFLFRGRGDPNFNALPFIPVDLAADGAVEPAARETAVALAWNPARPGTPGLQPATPAGIRLYCSDTRDASGVVPLPPDTVYRITYRLDGTTGVGQLWVDQAGGGPAALARVPDATLACTVKRPPSGWLARGNVKPLPGVGAFWMDDIRVSVTTTRP